MWAAAETAVESELELVVELVDNCRLEHDHLGTDAEVQASKTVTVTDSSRAFDLGVVIEVRSRRLILGPKSGIIGVGGDRSSCKKFVSIG